MQSLMIGRLCVAFSAELMPIIPPIPIASPFRKARLPNTKVAAARDSSPSPFSISRLSMLRVINAVAAPPQRSMKVLIGSGHDDLLFLRRLAMQHPPYPRIFLRAATISRTSSFVLSLLNDIRIVFSATSGSRWIAFRT